MTTSIPAQPAQEPLFEVDSELLERLMKRMTDAQITVSTVTLGRAGDPELMAKILANTANTTAWNPHTIAAEL